MKHLRGYVFKNGVPLPIEMDVSSSKQAHEMIAKAFPHYIFLIEREVENDE